jgi:glycosyltransferase involved in cell wall biosynthesis
MPGTGYLGRGLRQFVWGAKTIEWLDQLAPSPSAVVVCGGYAPYLRRLLPWSRRRGIPLVVDVVEWFQPSHLPGGAFGPFSINNELSLRWYYPRARNIVAISRYLEAHFLKRGCRTVRIPPTLDVAGTKPRTTPGRGPIRLAYAGVPGRKDLLDNVIAGLLRVDPKGEQVRLTIAGTTPAAVLRMPALEQSGAKALPPCIEVLGRVSHEQALSLIRDADFLPLLRPLQRYAQAGFPTKVPESLAAGTPVICNLTSDLGEYIRDGAEGFVAADPSVEGFIGALERALSTTVEARSKMRKAARETAEQHFDYRQYVSSFREFIANLQVAE